MSLELEQHILILLGNKPDTVTLSEQMLYMMMFLYNGSDSKGKYRNNLYQFKKGNELPHSPTLIKTLRNPRYLKDCWSINEFGIRITKKGWKKYMDEVVLSNKNNDKLANINYDYNELMQKFKGISDYELELIIQLRYWKWITKGHANPFDILTQKGEELDTKEVKSIIKNPDKYQDKIKQLKYNVDWTLQQTRRMALISTMDVRKNKLLQYIDVNDSDNNNNK